MTTPDLGVGSHVPVLAAAVAATEGPVLELGCGWWSTPMLRLLCRHRPLESYDTDPEWAKLFSVPVVKNWKQWLPNFKTYGAIFIDCSPGEERKELAMKLKGMAKFIVLHDAECDSRHGGGGNYRYDDIYGRFKYVEHYRVIRPVTAILSDVEPFGLTDWEKQENK